MAASVRGGPRRRAPNWAFYALAGTVLWSSMIQLPLHKVAAQPVPEVPDEVPAAAVQIYHKAQADYQAGRYAQAAQRLKQALALDPTSASLIYSVARVSAQLGAIDDAITYYQQYLTALRPGDKEERARIATQLAELKRIRPASQDPLRPPPSPDAVARAQLQVQANQSGHGAVSAQQATAVAPYRPLASPDSSNVENDLLWTTAGTGVGLLLAGTLTGVWALRKADAADNFVLGEDGSADVRRAVSGQASRLATAADVMLGSGALALGITLVLLLTQDTPRPTSRPAAQRAPTALPSGASAQGY